MAHPAAYGGGHAPARAFLEVGAMEIPEHTYLRWRGGFADGVVSLPGTTPP